MLYTILDSPVGELLLAGDGRQLHRLAFHSNAAPAVVDPSWRRSAEAFAPVSRQLEEYFAGSRRTFDIELAFDGGTFDRTVWHALLEVPYGETVSYGELARRIGTPDRARAVGSANARNPIALVVPCHRVIGADGSLTGYGGGLERKRLLLELEAGVLPLLSA
jgi:methylated-DNA-[protein]-cysteine S-methyltransferase